MKFMTTDISKLQGFVSNHVMQIKNDGTFNNITCFHSRKVGKYV